MKAKEIRGKSISELRRDRLELQREQFNLRMQKANDQLNRHSQLKSVRRDIARIETVLNEKKGNEKKGGEIA